MKSIPKCFISYSHDDELHKEWVLNLASRLVKNGVDVILDQWDLRLGCDLPSFMESGLTAADRVICICSDKYVSKSTKDDGGVAYEKMILTSGLMRNIKSEKIIPLIRNNNNESLLTPIFLQSKFFIDFRNDDEYEKSYISLIKEIHGESIKARPPLGVNPFEETENPIASSIVSSISQYSNPSFNSKVKFNYENNNGRYMIGEGTMQFELQFSTASNGAINIYNDPINIEGIALAYGVNSFSDIKDALLFDYTSRARTVKTGEFLILVNKNGFFAALKLGEIKARSHGSEMSSVSLEYRINQRREGNFE